MVYNIAENIRARGANSNVTGRFEPYVREIESDGWDIPEPAPKIVTEVRL